MGSPQTAAPTPSGASTSAGASAAGGGGGGAPPSSAPAASSPSSSSGPSSGTPSPVSGAGGAQQAAAERGVLDTLREIGLSDFAGQYQDDHAALQALALAFRQNQQVQPLLPYAQQYAQHAGQFQQWMQQQQAAAQQQAQKKQNPFGLPDLDQRLLQMVRRNEQTGQLEALPGAPFDAPQRVAEYAFKLREVQDQFWQDPMKFLGPMIQEAIRRDGSQLVQQGLGGYQEQVAAQQVVEQHADWLHQRDQAGNVVRDPLTKQPALSQWGQRFAQYVQAAEQMGLRGVKAQADYALGMVQRDALQAQYQATAAQQQGDAAKQQFLQQQPGAARVPNAGGSVQPPSPSGTAPSQQPSLNLKERLSRRFKENGFQVAQNVT